VLRMSDAARLYDLLPRRLPDVKIQQVELK